MILDLVELMIDWSVSVHAQTFMVQVVKFGLDNRCSEDMRAGHARRAGDVLG